MARKKNLKSYDLWQQYDQYIRSLHLKKPLKVPTREQIIRKFVKKLVVVAAGAFFTTLAFYSFINPNGLYNSGFNGLLQKISQQLVGRESAYFYLLYYGMGLTFNLLLIFVLRVKYRAKLDVIGTAFFYVLFQVAWVQVFRQIGLENTLFKDEPRTVSFFLIVSAIAAGIHTYGYSLIYRARATPGGLEIISAHFATQPKLKFSISFWNTLFGYGVLSAITLLDFFWGENNKEFLEYLLKKKELWATGFYIILSSMLMRWFFPREKIIRLEIYSSSEQECRQALHLLKNFSPFYHNVRQKKGQSEEVIYVTNCYLSGWNYFLLEPDLKATGKTYIHETS